jgi:hypothetical protein
VSLVDQEGETVDYAGYRDAFALRVMAAEWRIVLNVVRDIPRPGFSDVDELFVRSGRGLTDFFPRRKPNVKISARLQQSYLENRLRTTLTHEYGHVILHGFLFALDDSLQKLFDGAPKQTRNTCHREHIHGGALDWMEWQAGFACGALLMPQTELVRIVKSFRAAHDIPYAEIGVDSEPGRQLVAHVMDSFHVSQDAARVRLEQRKAILRNPVPGLFG